MRRKSIFTVLILIIFVLTGCGNGTDSSVDASTDSSVKVDGYNFIFVCPIIENEYWETCIEGIRKADAELGTTTKVVGPRTAENFATEIIGYMEDAVAEKPDGIMAYAGIEDMFPLIDEAVEQGIPVLALDSDAPSSKRIAYVGTDAYNSGYDAGQKMIELTGGNAKIGLLVSSLSAEKEMQVVNAFLDTVHDYDIEVVATAETDANPDIAEEKTRDMLGEHPEITAMFNTAGYNVTGAARVKRDLGLDNLVLVGFDDVEENLQFVREGVIDAILVQRIEQVGYQGVCLMKECVDKGGLPKDSYDTGTIIVTQENVDSYSSTGSDTVGECKTVRVGYYSGNEAFQDGFDGDARKSGYAYEYYQIIAALTGWQYEYTYGTRAEMLDMLIAGDVDIVAGIYQTDTRKEQVLFSNLDMGLDGDARYFAVNKERTDLLADLDYAMEQIRHFSPDFTVSLSQKYYSQITQQILTDGEKEWLARKGGIRLGYVRHNLPLSEQGEDGEPTGLISDLIDLMQDYLRVGLEPVCYENVSNMEAALGRGEIDAAFPFYSDLWLTEKKGFRQTDAFISDRVMVIYQGNYTSDLMDKVALSMTGIGQSNYLELYYPSAEVTYYDSRKDALDAIQRGDERCIVGCSSILQLFMSEHSEYQNLNIAYLDTSENFGMAVNQSESILCGILNKAIRQIDAATITSAMMKYSATDTVYTFRDFLQRYAIVFIMILIVFVALLLWIFVNYRRKTLHYNNEQAKTRKALEEALEAANVASEAKTTFLSSMSHDIRTPMNAIVGMTTIASQHLNDSDRVRDCLDKISLSSNHLLTLINDVLDISKIESGKLALNPVVFSLNDTVTNIVNIVRPEIKSKNLEFDVHIQDMKYDTVYADEVRVNQIFMNILTNAVKYTSSGGKVTLSLTEELMQGGQNVRLIYVVKDNGIGMSEEFMKNMYDTFARAKDSRINKIQGTGLGLSIVRQMVDMMGGTIECQSEEGRGTVFTVTLEFPIMDKADTADTDETSSESDLSGRHLLVAEDNELNWEVINELLGMYEITAERAENGQICVDMISAAKPGQYDAILMDIQMPVMNGRDATRVIRKSDSDYVRSIPVIALTADAFAEDIAACFEAGMDGHVAKPLDMGNLCQELRKVLYART